MSKIQGPRTPAIDNKGLRRLRLLIVGILITLTVQGWFGDTVNLFVPFPSGNVEASLSGLYSAVVSAGPVLIIHASIGLALLVLAITVLSFSIRSKPRAVTIPSVLGLVMVVSAVIGGILFVVSGFQNNGVSAQMGGSFIGAYAFYFIELYFAK